MQIPKRFWDDLDWARNHHTQLLREYVGQWVAVVDKKIVAFGKDLRRVKEEAKMKTKKTCIATMFVDGGEHIYAI